MKEIFEKPPLVELVAEVHWQPSFIPQVEVLSSGGGGITLSQQVHSNKAEEFCVRFGGEVYQHGYQRAERLIPAGVPAPVESALYRYTKGPQAPQDMFQVGAGMFCANALPPYKCWDAFSPTVRTGLECMLRASDEQDKDVQFKSVGLRYINSFGPRFLNGMSAVEFIEQKLGFKVVLPPVIQNESKQGIRSTLQFQFMSERGLQVAMFVGEGFISSERTLIWDINAAKLTATERTADAAMLVLNEAREIIHRIFVDATSSLADLMVPVGRN